MIPTSRPDDYDPGGADALPAGNPGRNGIRDSEKQLTVETALPGVDPDQMEVSILGDVLTIRAERRQARRIGKAGRQWRQFSQDRYARSVQLPLGVLVDAAQATFGNGVLTVIIPKGRTAAPKRIEVTRQ
ncbi:MAG: Hsp20/alpha crystallin family protein [Thermoleophilia bacterium]